MKDWKAAGPGRRRRREFSHPGRPKCPLHGRRTCSSEERSPRSTSSPPGSAASTLIEADNTAANRPAAKGVSHRRLLEKMSYRKSLSPTVPFFRHGAFFLAREIGLATAIPSPPRRRSTDNVDPGARAYYSHGQGKVNSSVLRKRSGRIQRRRSHEVTGEHACRGNDFRRGDGSAQMGGKGTTAGGGATHLVSGEREWAGGRVDLPVPPGYLDYYQGAVILPPGRPGRLLRAGADHPGGSGIQRQDLGGRHQLHRSAAPGNRQLPDMDRDLLRDAAVEPRDAGGRAGQAAHGGRLRPLCPDRQAPSPQPQRPRRHHRRTLLAAVAADARVGQVSGRRQPGLLAAGIQRSHRCSPIISRSTNWPRRCGTN